MNSEINLLPNSFQRNAVLTKRLLTLRLIAMVILFMVSFFSIALFISISLSPLPGLREREKEESTRLSFFSDIIVKIHLTKERLIQISGILKERTNFGSSISALQEQLPSDAVIDSVGLSENKLFVTATSKSLLPLDTFIKNILSINSTRKIFSTITLVSMVFDQEKQQYKMVMQLRPI